MTAAQEALTELDVTESEQALMLRAAWLYYIEQQTQSAIADALGVSRFRVNRMLAECRARGQVRFEIVAPLASCVALEHAAATAFGLREAVIVPSPTDPDRTHAMVGAGLARYMAGRLADSATKILGIGWGQTMREMQRLLRPCDRPDLKIVTMLGALPQSSEHNSIEIIGNIGRMLGAERYYMTGPIYADTPEARYVMAAQHYFNSMQEMILRADMACFAVGDMSPDSLLIRHALPYGVQARDLIAAGAVGDLLGTFIDRDGAAIDHPINRQLLGPGLTAMREMKSLVLASGGPAKIDAITAALRSGAVNVLVCDEETIRSVLKNTGHGNVPVAEAHG